MKFIFCVFQKTALHIAVENENIEMVKFLLSQKNVKIDALLIFIQFIIM